MTTSYKTLLTVAGRAAFAAAGRDVPVPIQLKYISVGDAEGTAYTPTGRETSLKRRVWRGTVHRAVSVPGHTDQLLVEGIVPASEGGWTVREVGLLDGRSRLLAIASYPETHKSTPQQGAGTEIVIQLILKVANAASVTLTLDSSAAFATTSALTDAVAAHALSRNHPAASTSARGLVELATPAQTEEGTDASLATTPEGVKTVRDKAVSASIATHAASRDHPAASTTEFGLVKLASTAQTKKGADDDLATTPKGVKSTIDEEIGTLKTSLSTLSSTSMTPAGVASAIDTDVETHAASRDHPDASVNARGLVELATNEETMDGKDDERATTPTGVKASIDVLAAAVSIARSSILSAATSYARVLVSTHASESGHPAATTNRQGPVELATSPETTSGRSASLAVTPAGMKTTMTARLASLYSVPTGAIMAYGSATAPSGWLLCDGSTFRASAYRDLYRVIGRRFGGSVTYPNLPDLFKKFVMGDGSDTSVGDTGGDTSHTHRTAVWVGGHTLTIGSIPSHRHYGGTGSVTSGEPGRETSQLPSGRNLHMTTHPAGGSQAHAHSAVSTTTSAATLPPYVVLAYIIRT